MIFFASFVRIRLTSLAMNCSTGAFPSTTQHPILAQNFLDILIIIYFQQKAYFIPYFALYIPEGSRMFAVSLTLFDDSYGLLRNHPLYHHHHHFFLKKHIISTIKTQNLFSCNCQQHQIELGSQSDSNIFNIFNCNG